MSNPRGDAITWYINQSKYSILVVGDIKSGRERKFFSLEDSNSKLLSLKGSFILK